MNASKSAAAALLSLILVMFLVPPLLRAGFKEPAEFQASTSPSEALWIERDFETLLQGFLILGGVFAILMLLRTARKGVQT